MKVVMMRGVPGSGKSSWAREHMHAHDDVVRVNRDELRMMLHNSVYSQKNEELVVEVERLIVQHGLAAGQTVLVDDTNLSEYHYNLVKRWADGVEVEVMEMETPLEECIARDARREMPVGRERIEIMWAKLQKEKMKSAPE